MHAKPPLDKSYQERLDFDKRESSAISLSMDMENEALLMEDLKGKIVAVKLKPRPSGAFGPIMKAKQSGTI
jgi:predicted nucleic acid-binding protein